MNYHAYKSPRSSYRKIYDHRRHNGIPTSLVDADQARTHLANIYAHGWSWAALATMAGDMSHQGLRFVAEGEYKTIERRTERLILAIPYSLKVPDVVSDEMLVAAEGATRRARALLALGWTRTEINQHTWPHRADHLARGSEHRITAAKWRAMNNAYQQLHMTPGPSPINRQRAIKLGYAPPLAWDCIDAPDETPTQHRYSNPNTVDLNVVNRILSGRKTEATHAERAETIRRWTQRGDSLSALERVTGWNVDRELKRMQQAS